MGAEEIILVVEDDPDMREIVCTSLSQDGFRVLEAGDAAQMRRVLAQSDIDLVILDLVLPGESGFDLARELRKNSDIPMIMVTGRGDVIDKVVGLELGADDYITKPFFPRELVARVRTVLRRTRPKLRGAPLNSVKTPPQTIRFGPWVLDLSGQRLTKSTGESVTLTTYEFQVLSVLAQHPGKALSRDQIMDLVAEREWNPFDRSIDVLIGKVRKKLGDDSRDPRFIRTVRNMGYMFLIQNGGDSQA